MDYYDLIDTLITVPGVTNYSTYLSNLQRARVKYQPRGRFVIITSQPTAARRKIEQLVKNLFPNCVGVYQVNGTLAKTYVLRTLGADNYTENDPQVRAAIANKLPEVKLYKITSGQRVEA
jgi:hypothetical protein